MRVCVCVFFLVGTAVTIVCIVCVIKAQILKKKKDKRWGRVISKSIGIICKASFRPSKFGPKGLYYSINYPCLIL